MIVLDASVVIALFNISDDHHDAALAVLNDNARLGFGMHPLTLAEVLVGGVRVGRANQMLSDLRAMGVESVQPAPDEPLILAELRVATGLKMPDCCVLAVALRKSAPLATFDDQLARGAESLGLTQIV